MYIVHGKLYMSLSQVHKIHVGKYYCDYQAYNRTYHATHHLLDDEHANDEDDKTRYVISEVTHKSLTKPSPIEPNQAFPKGRMFYNIDPYWLAGYFFYYCRFDFLNVSTPP